MQIGMQYRKSYNKSPFIAFVLYERLLIPFTVAICRPTEAYRGWCTRVHQDVYIESSNTLLYYRLVFTLRVAIARQQMIVYRLWLIYKTINL